MADTNPDIKNRLKSAYDMVENPPTIAGLQSSTVFGGISAATDLGLGLWGMFKDNNIGAPGYESTYQTSGALPGIRDAALRDAFGGGDDYAARIRAKNVQRDAVNSAINRSGGSRAFVQSNVAAADDVFNLQNLGIDKMMGDRKTQNLQIAGQMENLVIQDKLNKMKDMQYSNEDKYRKHMAEITLDRDNRRGAMGMIKSGLNNFALTANNEEQWGVEGSMRNLMKMNALREMAVAGINPWAAPEIQREEWQDTELQKYPTNHLKQKLTPIPLSKFYNIKGE